MATISTLPDGIGLAKHFDDESRHGVPSGNFYVQTPDSLWTAMYQRMRSQVNARDTAMAKWEKDHHGRIAGDEAYWVAYYTEKARHRIDYPMPWGHIMFGR